MLNSFSEEDRKLLDVDVLKVGHHGSHTSSSVAFIQKVSPSVAVISCGAPDTGTNDRYKHPRLVTIRHFADWFEQNAPKDFVSADWPTKKLNSYDKVDETWRMTKRPKGVWVTDIDGAVTISCDGQKLQVQSAND
jgi:beta-lactamase superfamily II metal-dependent hydrolase